MQKDELISRKQLINKTITNTYIVTVRNECNFNCEILKKRYEQKQNKKLLIG